MHDTGLVDIPENQLTTLLAIADLGTFDAAARHLHLTPSAVSQRVRALESTVGQVVVQRSAPCRPTPAGQSLLRLARQTRLLRSEALAELGGIARRDLPVAVNADSLAIWWQPVLREVGTWDGVALRLVLDDQAHCADLLRSGEALAAVTSDDTAVQGCSVEPLGTLRYLPAATPELADRHRRGRSLDWQRLPVVVFNEKDRLQHDALAQHEVEVPDVAHRVPTSADFLTAVTVGLGWGMVPEPQLRPLVAAGDLVVLDRRGALDVRLFWQRWRLDSPLLDRLTGVVHAAARDALRR